MNRGDRHGPSGTVGGGSAGEQKRGPGSWVRTSKDESKPRALNGNQGRRRAERVQETSTREGGEGRTVRERRQSRHREPMSPALPAAGSCPFMCSSKMSRPLTVTASEAGEADGYSWGGGAGCPGLAARKQPASRVLSAGTWTSLPCLCTQAPEHSL